jgi:Protein of unknown function (DUF1214)
VWFVAVGFRCYPDLDPSKVTYVEVCRGDLRHAQWNGHDRSIRRDHRAAGVSLGLARWGFDYLSRAATARSNMYDNAPEETRYIYTDFDSQGQQLNGSQAYTVTFPKGGTPPVDGFWSLTLYNKEDLFSPDIALGEAQDQHTGVQQVRALPMYGRLTACLADNSENTGDTSASRGTAFTFQYGLPGAR